MSVMPDPDLGTLRAHTGCLRQTRELAVAGHWLGRQQALRVLKAVFWVWWQTNEWLEQRPRGDCSEGSLCQSGLTDPLWLCWVG